MTDQSPAPDRAVTPPPAAGCRILLANPNTSASVTQRMVSVARSVAAPGTVVVGVEASRGVPYITSRAEAVISGAAVLELLADHCAAHDVAIVAAFGDPGLMAARDLLPIPVIGLAEAAMLTACMLGRQFSIVSFSTAFAHWYRECVEVHGLEKRLASIRLLDEPFEAIETVGRDKRERLIDLARSAVEQDGAEVIVLAGAPLAGIAAEMRDRIAVPILDGVAAAVRQAEAVVALGAGGPMAGAARGAGTKPSVGLPGSLAALMGA